jgi:hypothetical protein
MTWSVRNRLALIPVLVLFGAAAGCGDNTPPSGQGGAGGGMTGMGGNTGDGGPDADATGAAGSDAGDGAAGSDAGDATGTAGSDAGDGAAGHDAGDATGAGGSDAGAGHDGAAGSDATGAGGSDATGAGGSDASGTAGSDGGAGTGGNGGTGGGGTGGSAGTDGGAGDGGTDTTPPAPLCYSVSFTKPVDNAMLSAADDKGGDQCADGFQYDIVIATGAPDGTSVQLFGGASLLAMTTVSGGAATFSNVQLASNGVTNLSIQFPTTMPCTDPTTKAKVTVNCSVPTCSVSKPIISATHPKLNGVPAAQGGDRASAIGSPYQVAFEVTTNIADNQTVSLDVDDAANASAVTTITAMAAGGKAVFAGVPLPNDGHTYEVQARCTDGNGVVGRSGKGSYPVDITPPDLTVSKPASGDFLGPSELTNGAFQVCGSTMATDAVGLPATLGAGQKNYCVTTTGSPSCVAAGTVNVDTCVSVPCPGDAPFGITVTLTDAAGNPTTTTLTGITCSAATPTVQIITPVSDAPAFNDPTKHLLAATAAQAFKDKDGTMPGAQTDVVACTSRAGTAALFAGHTGDATLTLVAGGVATVAAVPADNCPAGLGFVAKFTTVTLPESVESATGALTTATEIRVDLTDSSSSTGSSMPLDLWVDSVAPTIALSSPANFCGSFEQAVSTFDTDVSYTTDTSKVTMTILNGTTTDTLTSPNFAAGTATFTNISFALGLNHITAVAADPAGNTTTATPNPCDLTVGMAPVVIFTTPTSSNVLCSTAGVAPNCIDDADGTTPGWQGSLTVQVLVGGVALTSGLNNVTFSVGSNSLGTVPIDNTGHATLTGVTFNDGTVTITATTDNVAGAGVGAGSVTVVVDLGPPNAPTNLAAAVLDRRQTSFQLSWTAPSDIGGGPVAGYQVRYSQAPINAGNFDDPTMTTAVTYTGTPSAVGALDGIAVQKLYIENGYYFAVEAVDAAGNRSPLIATNTAVTAHFNVNFINSPTGTNQEFGQPLDGSGDVNGDGVSDLIIGTAVETHAYIFFGKPGFAPTMPDVTISGTNTGFGSMVRWIGDVDGDGIGDLAVSDPVGSRVFIYRGRSTWPATLTDAQASFTVTGDATYNLTTFGSAVAPLGDFDGDGIDDFVIGAAGYSANAGRVDVIYGSTTFSSFTVPSATRALGINGDPALNRTLFGSAVVGLGHFYSGTGTTLVVSGPGLGSATSTSSNEGRLFAFHGRGPGADIDASAANNVFVGPGKGAKIGFVLANLGPVVNSLPSCGSGNTSDNLGAPLAGSTGSALVLSGSVATGPFSSSLAMTETSTTAVGQVIFGGGFSGSDVSVSLIGGSGPDVVTTGQSSTAIDIIDGAQFATLTSPTNVRNTAAVHVPMPAGWKGTGRAGGNLIKDINGDTYPDFALGDVFGLVPGRTAIFW